MSYVEKDKVQYSTVIDINSTSHIPEVIDKTSKSNDILPQCIICCKEEYFQRRVIKWKIVMEENFQKGNIILFNALILIVAQFLTYLYFNN